MNNNPDEDAGKQFEYTSNKECLTTPEATKNLKEVQQELADLIKLIQKIIDENGTTVDASGKPLGPYQSFNSISEGPAQESSGFYFNDDFYAQDQTKCWDGKAPYQNGPQHACRTLHLANNDKDDDIGFRVEIEVGDEINPGTLPDELKKYHPDITKYAISEDRRNQTHWGVKYYTNLYLTDTDCYYKTYVAENRPQYSGLIPECYSTCKEVIESSKIQILQLIESGKKKYHENVNK
jgi:hypothetical protein